MAFPDNQLSFNTNWSTPQALSLNGSNADSTGVIDLTGAGSGTLPNIINGFPATNTAVGYDIGAGDGSAIPYLYVSVTTAGTGAHPLVIELLAAPDNGSGSQGSYTQLYQSSNPNASTLVKGSTLLVPVPPTLFNWPSEAPPRFYKLNYSSTGGAITLSVLAGILLNPPSTLLMPQYNENFIVV